MRCFSGAVLLVMVAMCSTADADEVADARRAFISGMKHFDLGEYKQALADFKDGYRAKEDPVFLYNIAQCYRLMKENVDAIRYYRLYISRAPDASNRGEIENRISTLQAIVEAEQRRPRTPLPTTAGLATPPAQTAAASGIVATTTTATATAPVKKTTPIYKKWWLWTIVGVAAAGAGVGLGLGLTHLSSTTSGTTFPTAGF
jgi:tetratricopeptide (TPR) repeat protein